MKGFDCHFWDRLGSRYHGIHWWCRRTEDCFPSREDSSIWRTQRHVQVQTTAALTFSMISFIVRRDKEPRPLHDVQSPTTHLSRGIVLAR
ncbi:hypothetical protein BKA82DRAFT_326586 [Pisolithus tinctorius]|uniref:Uncharacterized protein n=1 Tax=Pisolithus tinctorius Marx 270 TaxID=870435 RepID=A0A0C3PJL1_PISTI|nr:hypothetical protein BKA82DRAFT_326586 [Pisolithus tinctorius]KIO08801.1 hypothetical protein M404DRAFT_326586 [Pisolithus tinctorius Marx 270]